MHRTDLTESIKLAFEDFKHLTTLNAGSIVLIGTFLQGIFPSENGTLTVGLGIKLLIALSFFCFGASLALASLVMYQYTRVLRNYLSDALSIDRDRHVRIWLVPPGLPLLLFWFGLTFFGLAVVINLL
jgi:hypothetical protein